MKIAPFPIRITLRAYNVSVKSPWKLLPAFSASRRRTEDASGRAARVVPRLRAENARRIAARNGNDN